MCHLKLRGLNGIVFKKLRDLMCPNNKIVDLFFIYFFSFPKI